jgi:hypothetical protein
METLEGKSEHYRLSQIDEELGVHSLFTSMFRQILTVIQFVRGDRDDKGFTSGYCGVNEAFITKLNELSIVSHITEIFDCEHKTNVKLRHFKRTKEMNNF